MKISIYSLDESPLDSVECHRNLEGITRFFANGFLPHIALHEIDVKSNNQDYVDLHKHDFDEINILLDDDIKFEYNINGTKLVIEGRKVIFIPRGVMHAQKIIEGRGKFLCIRQETKL